MQSMGREQARRQRARERGMHRVAEQLLLLGYHVPPVRAGFQLHVGLSQCQGHPAGGCTPKGGLWHVTPEELHQRELCLGGPSPISPMPGRARSRSHEAQTRQAAAGRDYGSQEQALVEGARAPPLEMGILAPGVNRQQMGPNRFGFSPSPRMPLWVEGGRSALNPTNRASVGGTTSLWAEVRLAPAP